MAESKVSLRVSLYVKELMHDIMNKTYLTGQAREKAGMGFEEASNMQASKDDENDYQLRRSLCNHFTALKSLIGEYLTETGTTADNKIPEIISNDENAGSDSVLELSFSMPSNYNKSSVGSLGSNIHAYLVNMSVYDWFTITNKADAKDYYDLAAVSLETVKRALYKRSRPTRPTYAATSAGS